MIYIDKLTQTQKANLDTLNHSDLKKFKNDDHLLELLHHSHAIKEFLRNEYLSREKITLNKNITRKHIKVTSDNTIWIDISAIDLQTEKEFLDKVKELRKLAKAKGTKLIGANKLNKFIKENYEEYEKIVNQYSENFDTLRKEWSTYELHYGVSDDTYYKNVLQKAYFEMQKMTNLNTPLGRLGRKMQNVDRYIDDLASGAEYTSIGI